MFVFAITQATGYVASDPSWTRLVQAMAILAVLWFAWSGYAWLGNTANTDEGPIRLILLTAMAALFIASLAVPHAFGRSALLFGAALFIVRGLHIVCYAVVARAQKDPTLAVVVRRLASTILPAAGLLVVAGILSGRERAACWVAAIVVDYLGIVIRGVDGWRVEPGHFAERHSAVIIIALGESIASLGAGAHAVHLGPGVIAGAVLGIATAGALWWAYFDVVAIVAEQRLRRAEPQAQVLIARDSYTFLHLPMVAGIIVFAVGARRTLLHVNTHLGAVAACALCGGVAVYLVALSTFKRRNVGSFNAPRLLVASVLCVFAPAGRHLPALVTLGVVTAILCGLIAFEFVRYAEARDRIRHGAQRE